MPITPFFVVTRPTRTCGVNVVDVVARISVPVPERILARWPQAPDWLPVFLYLQKVCS